MNQILSVSNKNGKKNNSTGDLRKIIIIFSVAIIIFGVILVVNGAISLNKNNGKGQEGIAMNTPGNIASPSITPTPEEPEGDTTPPTIEMLLSGELIRIVATDETEIDYIEYGWNDENSQIIYADNSLTEIQTYIVIEQGTNVLNVAAVDKEGNRQEKTQEFQGKIRPVVKLLVNETKNEIIVEADCTDGISKIEYNLNGQWTKIPFEEMGYYTQEQWESIGVITQYSEDGKIINAKYNVSVIQGQNKLSVYAYSSSGLVGEASGVHNY